MSVEQRILYIAEKSNWYDSRELCAIALEVRKMDDRIKQLDDRIKQLEEMYEGVIGERPDLLGSNVMGLLKRELNTAQNRIKRLEGQLMDTKNKHSVLIADVVLNNDRAEQIKRLSKANLQLCEGAEEAKQRIQSLIAERDTARLQADQKVSLREEFRELIGTGDIEQGVAVVREMKNRIKRLEEALKCLTLVVGLTPIAGNKNALQEAIDIAIAELQAKETKP